MIGPWEKLIAVAGIGPFGLVAANLTILRWLEDLARLRPLTW
jgi:hypothetical protein